MRAIVQTDYGTPDVLELRDIQRPEPKEDEALVRIRAAALHAGDCFLLAGSPYVARFSAGWPKPKDHIPGYDLAGTVEAVGPNVSAIRPGQEVFGAGSHTCAEYACVRVDTLVVKPADVSFSEAAAVPTSGLAALHGLRDAGKVGPGWRVLVNGASGGVGTFAVQIAKELGAEVTGVCSTRNVDLVRSIGADHVIDYTQEDFTATRAAYDLILDNVANRSFSDLRRALTTGGVVLPNSGNSGLGYVVKAFVRSLYSRQQGRPFVSSPNQADLTALQGFVEKGAVAPVIDRAYTLEEVPAALRYLSDGHARGKVVVTIGGSD